VIVLQNYNVDITVDGGVSDATAASCSAAGANIMVAGSHLFSQSDLTQAVANLRAAAGSADVSG
jgi:ribulose-phosphate 3-epimerase